ncbi:MAG: type II toxin-antitoxin system RelE/ParE family toxin [bacterium]
MRAKLTPTARRDLDEVRKYTVARWGRPQWLRYFTGLSAAFERIAREPRCGLGRDVLQTGLRSLTVEQHVIFFHPIRHAGGAVIIVRIIHQRRNFAALSFAGDLDN